MLKRTPPAPSASSRQEGNSENSPAINPLFEGACQKCAHRKTCIKPCFFVEKYLNFQNKKPFEKDLAGLITIISPQSNREIRTCELDVQEDGDPTGRTQKIFSTDNPGAFANAITPTLKQTGIFIDRFFFRMGYKELSEKYDSSVSGIAKLYVNAKDRIVKSIEAMDRLDTALENGKPIVKMNRAVRAFLLHTAFGLPVGEIAKVMGVTHALISRNLKNVRDQIITGEVTLFDFTDKDVEEAVIRMEKIRAERRDYDKDRKRPPRKKVCKDACQ